MGSVGGKLLRGNTGSKEGGGRRALAKLSARILAEGNLSDQTSPGRW